MSGLVVENACLSYKDNQVLKNFDLTIGEGEFVTLLGASGSGKTSMLRIVGGYVMPTSGTVRLGGREVTTLPPQKRNIGTVFQQYALFPHMTVAHNVAFGLHVRHVPKAELQERLKEALELVDLSHLSERYPPQLSGGQQQRVALARAIVVNPSLLLMDEPMGALDVSLRGRLQQEVKRIQTTLGITTLYVTHDQSEAFAMSDRIVIVHDGRPIHSGTPTELYRDPRSAITAKLLGHGNVVRVGGVTGGVNGVQVQIHGDTGTLALPHAESSEGSHVLFASGALTIAGDGDAHLRGTAVSQTFTEGVPHVAVRIGDETLQVLDREMTAVLGETVGLKVDSSRVSLLVSGETA